jgi:hypothetical protein
MAASGIVCSFYLFIEFRSGCFHYSSSHDQSIRLAAARAREPLIGLPSVSALIPRCCACAGAAPKRRWLLSIRPSLLRVRGSRSTPGLRRGVQRERGTSGLWQPSIEHPGLGVPPCRVPSAVRVSRFHPVRGTAVMENPVSVVLSDG